MQVVNRTRRVILDATLEHTVIRGTLIADTGEQREFHGWLELNTALEAMLAVAATRQQQGPVPPTVDR